jgi:GntR family transcriptional regulator
MSTHLERLQPTIGHRPGSARRPHSTPVRGPAQRLTRLDDTARRLRDLLRGAVFDGAYPDGLLPSEGELMLTYAVPRAAVREALSMLRCEGVVERVQGIGTFAVRERCVTRMSEMHGEAKGGLLDECMRPEVLDRSVVPAPDLVARKLELEAGEHVLRLEYVSYLDGEPIGLATNYAAFPEAEALRDTHFVSDWYALLRDAGVALGGSEWVLGSVNADAAVARRLAVAPGTAIMLAEQLIWDERGRPYDVAFVYVRSDRYVFSSRAWNVT